MNYVKGDLFSVTSGIIVHGCNAQGVMGSGVAKSVKAQYPEAFKKYVADIKNGMTLGDVSWFMGELAIASAITQDGFGFNGHRYVSYDAVSVSFMKVFSVATKYGFEVSMPKIGAGLGGGSWTVIEQIILDAATKQKFQIDNITVYEL